MYVAMYVCNYMYVVHNTEGPSSVIILMHRSLKSEIFINMII